MLIVEVITLCRFYIKGRMVFSHFFLSQSPLPKGIHMDYEMRMDKILHHLEKHPHDYQSKISLLKLNSKRIEHERRQVMIGRLRNLAEIRRRNHEQSDVE